MSDNFKFLTQASENSNTSDKAFAQEDAAQSFLDKKLSNNRFTQQQQETLDDNGGSKDFGSNYNKVITNQDEIDSFNNNKLDDSRGFDSKSDSGRNYSNGAWGSGDLDAEALANKYQLDRSQEGRGEGHIWGRNRDGTDVYIGKSSMDLASNQELISNHAKQANSNEIDHSSKPDNLSSSGDIKGAILTEWDGGAKVQAPEPKEELVKIEHSPEIEQAKERVKAYEDDVLSGKVSEDIYGSDKYSFEATKGAAGIGTPLNGSSSNQADLAADSFLDSKKEDLKKKYQFQAQS